MVHEVGKRNGPRSIYGHIKADRWSCGHALLHLPDRVREEGSRLRMLATMLKASVVQERPLLLETKWHKWLAAASPPDGKPHLATDVQHRLVAYLCKFLVTNNTETDLEWRMRRDCIVPRGTNN
jgi:hypothetical protein